MTTTTGTITTPLRQSVATSSGANGVSGSNDLQGLNNFTSLLAALFAAPQLNVQNQIPATIPNALGIPLEPPNLNLSGNQPNVVESSAPTNSSVVPLGSSVSATDSLSSLLFANSLTTQLSNSTATLKQPVVPGNVAPSILGQASVGTNNLGEATPSNNSTTPTLLASILGQSAVATNGKSSSPTPALLTGTGIGANNNASSAQSPLTLSNAPANFSPANAILPQDNSGKVSLAKTSVSLANAPSVNSDSSSQILPESNSILTGNQIGLLSGSTSQASNLQTFGLQRTTSLTQNVAGGSFKSLAKLSPKQGFSELSTASDTSNANASSNPLLASFVSQFSQSPTSVFVQNSSAVPLTASPSSSGVSNIAVPTNQNIDPTGELFIPISAKQNATASITTDRTTRPVAAETFSVVVNSDGVSRVLNTALSQNGSTQDLTANQQSAKTFDSPVLINGRSQGQSVILPTLPQTSQAQIAGADAYPSGFFSVTGIDRPTDAVAQLGNLAATDPTAGGDALFVRERNDVADLNSLLRGQPSKISNENSGLQSGVTNFTTIVDNTNVNRPAATTDQPAKVLTQLADAIAERAQVIREKGSTEIRMRLDPPDLGTIDIRVHSHKGELRADITAADPTVRTMIESQLADLRSSLENSGLDFQSFNLNSGGRSDRDNQQSDNPGYRTGYPREAPSASSSVVTPSTVVNPSSGSLLDVTA